MFNETEFLPTDKWLPFQENYVDFQLPLFHSNQKTESFPSMSREGMRDSDVMGFRFRAKKFILANKTSVDKIVRYKEI